MRAEPHFPFSPHKATEVAAQFVKLAHQRINIMRLVKLVYLLDRESISRRGRPVVGGTYLSMRNGPVTSEMLDLINSGFLWHRDTNWEEFISARRNYEVELTHDPGREHLSEVELGLIAEVFALHEGEDQFALLD